MHKLAAEAIQNHSSENDCWIVINNKVYDITSFLHHHPGGASIILQYAGKDATDAFLSIHSTKILSQLSPSALVGEFDTSTSFNSKKEQKQHKIKHDKSINTNTSNIIATPAMKGKSILPPIDEMFNLYDFEYHARKVLSIHDPAFLSYYETGVEDEVTLRENQIAFQRIFLKGRAMCNMTSIDTSCKILGYNSSIPLYLSTTGLNINLDPLGEATVIKACMNENVIYMLGNRSSRPFDDIMNDIAENYDDHEENISLNSNSDLEIRPPVILLQLYVGRDRDLVKRTIDKAIRRGCKAICITVDQQVLSRRERSIRGIMNNSIITRRKRDAEKTLRIENNINNGDGDGDDTMDPGEQLNGFANFVDSSLNWKDMSWFQSVITSICEKYNKKKIALMIKGVQTADDAILAYEYGLDGIIVSNHGGRQVDYARSAIECLVEVMNGLKGINYVKSKFQVFVDGGIRRGSDIFKALALGATAVGIARPYLFGMATYGQKGIEKVIQLLKGELQLTMSQMGTTKVQDIRRDMVLIDSLFQHTTNMPTNELRKANYSPFLFPRSKL